MTVAERPKSALEAPLEHEIDPSVQDELMQHPGKWAALTRSRVIAVRDTAREAYDAAVAEGISSPIMYLVPVGGESYFL
jgi:Family of unknown function (DUF5678)